MKFEDLVKFIEEEVDKVAKQPKEESVSKADSKPEVKPVTINIKRVDAKLPKDIDLEENDFEEIMFFKLDEEDHLRKRIRKIIAENFLPDVVEGGKAKPQFEVYNNSFTDACSQAINLAKNRGFEVDEEDWFNRVSTGPKKPSPGVTNRYSIGLVSQGVLSKKQLHFQVYGMEGGKYELNAYIQ